MMAVLQHAVPIATLVFVVSSMLAMGLGLTISQITAPLRNVRLVAMSLLANFVLMPATAVLLARVLRLDETLRCGIAAAGGRRRCALSAQTRADRQGRLGICSGVDGGADGHHRGLPAAGITEAVARRFGQPGANRRSLIVLMLLPLAAALAVKARLPSAAAAGKPWCDRLSTLGLVAAVLLLVVVNFADVVSVFDTRAILAGLIFIAFGYAVGWALGGPTAGTRPVLGLGTAQRNIAAALVVGGQNFTDPNVVVMVVVVAIVSLLILLPLSRRLAKAPRHQ
jgi:BASS family bile acid:Na+ symporter